MKITKILGGAALLSLGLVSLASCGESSENGSNTNTNTNGNTTTNNGGSTGGTIKFYTTAGDNLKAILESAKTVFENDSQNEGWTVEITNGYSYSTLNEKVTSDLTAGNQPTLAYCYGDHVAGYLKTKKVVDFNKFIEKDTDFKTNIEPKLITSYYNEGTQFGDSSKRYTMPLAKSTDAVYINKTVVEPILKELNIDVNDPNSWTWDALWKVCERLKALYPNSTPLGYDSESNWTITYLEEVGAKNGGKKYYTDGTKSGSDKLLFVNDETKAFFNTVYQKYDAGLVTTKGTYGNYTSGLFSLYRQGDSATALPEDNDSYKKSYTGSFISIGSTGGASHQLPTYDAQFEVMMAPEPSLNGYRKQISQGPSLVMFDEGSEALQQAAWRFVKVLLSDSVQQAYAKASAGYSPVRSDSLSSLIESLDTSESTGKINKQCLQVLEEVASDLYTSDCFNGSAVARTQIENALITLLKDTSSMSVDKKIINVLEAAFEECEYVL